MTDSMTLGCQPPSVNACHHAWRGRDDPNSRVNAHAALMPHSPDSKVPSIRHLHRPTPLNPVTPHPIANTPDNTTPYPSLLPRARPRLLPLPLLHLTIVPLSLPALLLHPSPRRSARRRRIPAPLSPKPSRNGCRRPRRRGLG